MDEKERRKRTGRLRQMTESVLTWYRANRRDLLWRQDDNPYHIWVSEIMLQQTRVTAVTDYYARFIEKLPTVEALADVPQETLLKLWQGLGYYNRARNLQKAAQKIVSEYGGHFPREYDEILKLPGIGAYTAGAVASIAFDARVPAVDGNVCRIYARIFEDASDISQERVRKEIRAVIGDAVPAEQPGTFNQALMELGAVVCLPNGQPLCAACPVRAYCAVCESPKACELPRKSAKKPRKRQDKTVFVLEYEGRYLIRKRPEKGLLAGLWEFPSCEGKRAVSQIKPLFADWDVDFLQVGLLGSSTHIFTHVEWRMIGYLLHLKKIPAACPVGLVWATPEELKTIYSIPSAFSAYLKQVVP